MNVVENVDNQLTFAKHRVPSEEHVWVSLLCWLRSDKAGECGSWTLIKDVWSMGKPRKLNKSNKKVDCRTSDTFQV